MALVSVLQAKTYGGACLRANIDRHFEALGIEGDLRPGMRVLIKPNLLVADRPERTATTHPAVVAAVAGWLRDRGVADIVVADSPGGAYRRGSLKAVYEACGYSGLQDSVTLNYDTGSTAVKSPDGFVNKSFNIINPIVNADYIINVAKLKTHGLTTVSAGIKNLFGAIPGLQKPEWHMRHPGISDFCHMLLELAQLVAPQVTVIDAVDTMEGNGPLNGRVRHMGLTLASRDVFAIDWHAARLMGVDPESVPMLHSAARLGLVSPGDIETRGDEAGPADPPYLLPDTLGSGSFFARLLPGFIRRVRRAVPAVDWARCVGCGKCAESCPMHIITIREKKADIALKGCISCFCCQEMCPFDAVRVRHVLRMPKL